MYKYLAAILCFSALQADLVFEDYSDPVIWGAMGYPENYANDSRSNISLDGEWKYKRITVEVDGYKIDATIVGKATTLNNGRWMLASNGNGEFYEDKLSYSDDFKQNWFNYINFSGTPQESTNN